MRLFLTGRVPTQHADIVVYQRMRSAFNHMTVMFKKDMVLKAGNYEDGLYMEDDLLWLNMIAAGAKTGNLDQSCVRFVSEQECLTSWGTALPQTLSSSSSAHAEERANFLHGVCQECCHSDDCCPLSRICPTVYFYETVTKKQLKDCNKS